MGFLDSLDSGGDERRRANDILRGVRTPDESDLALQLQRLVQVGELRPEDVETILQGPSAYQEIGADPRLRGAQTDTLGRYREIADAGGLDARAKLGLEDALDAQRTETRGQEGAIAANMRARGIGGSDMEALQRFVAQQGAAQRGSRAALEQAAIGQGRRDDALTQGATLAGNIRTQDFGEASAKAGATDAISRYNAVNAQDVAGQNVRTRNAAQATNLGARQGIADQNVGLENQQRTRQANLPLELYSVRQGNAVNLANQQNANAAAEAQRNQQLASMIAAGAMAFSDERVKEDIDPQGVDSEAILRDLGAATWQYKDDPTATRHAGPMAQQLEKGPLASTVHDTPGGKVVDYGAMGFESGDEGGLTLSLLSDLNQRLSELEAMKGGAHGRG